MTREEIREHLTELFEQTEGIKEPANLAEAVLWVLNEDGVVRKVNRESDAVDDIAIYPTAVYKNEKLIHERTPHEEGWNDGVIETTKRFIEAGYEAVESLI